ncbi:VWA domain-containing protein [Billgrantia azerbaijanica]|nr:VWA domain-containing protein [Halomonas azerbaijanica]
MTAALRPDYPFSAVVGQEALKTALILNAVNPHVGGVLISGPRGSAKSTLARGLADILPGGEAGASAPFVNLPLGATEDRLVGTLDLQRALDDRSLAYRPGLLARANGGILYVDEVNLLADALVDLLLDTAARGIHSVERDGISHTHEARFLLIGTMNPDEGELRPQLLDRFGLSVQLDSRPTVAERVAIVRRRETFERDPLAFLADVAPEQQALQHDIAAARSRLVDTRADDAIYRTIAERCEAAGVDGVRADIVWLQAALAHAAWQGRRHVTQADVDAVEPWVLDHRRNADAPAEPPPPPPAGDSQGGGNGSGTGHPPGNDWGAMPPEPQASVAVTLPDTPSAPITPSRPPAQAPLEAGRRRGRQGAGTHAGDRESRHPDWFATLVANHGRWPPRQWRFRKQRSGQPWLHLVLIDTSGSTLRQQLFGRAKGAVEQLAHRAYRAREQLAVLGFGNDRVQTLLPRQRAPKRLASRLATWTGGGGTPLRAALTHAAELVRRWRRRHPGLHIRTWIITDGRTRESLATLPTFDDCVVVDVEDGVVKRGRTRELAHHLGASRLTLPTLEAT